MLFSITIISFSQNENEEAVITAKAINYDNFNDSCERAYYTKSNYLVIKEFKNNKFKILKHPKIGIYVNEIEYEHSDSLGFIKFPKIDSSANIKLEIESKNLKFDIDSLHAKDINFGTTIIIGKIRNFEKLTNSSESQISTSNSTDYEKLIGQFAIGRYSLHVWNYKRIRLLKFIIIDPRQYGDGTYRAKTEILELKKTVHNK